MRRILSVCLLLAALSGAQVAAAHEHGSLAVSVGTGLGRVRFDNSGAPQAQPDFIRGLLLLHSFEYSAARQAFQSAQRIDPAFVMAYCGEALSYNQTLWGEQDLGAARRVLDKLADASGERAVAASSARERDYLATVKLLFGAGDKPARDASFSDALRLLSRHYPDDLEAQAFYALSILGLSNGVRNVPNYMRAAAQAEAVYEKDRQHPGALHYLIHAYDDPVHAPLGLRAANSYGSVAPAASHALHMPSHIYFALGMWDEAIAANVASLRVARKQHEGGYHSLVWLVYAYLQQDRTEEARALIRSVAQDVAASPNKENRIRLAHLHAIWSVETGRPQEIETAAAIDSRGIASIGYFDANDFAAGIAAAAGDSERRDALARLRQRARNARTERGMVTADWHDNVTAAELAQAEIMAAALEATIKFHAGERAAGLAQLRAAVAQAGGEEFEYGPPWSVKPLGELLGELLLADGRSAEAATEFRQVLVTYPNRRIARERLAVATAPRTSD